ncbi:hypothetical protein JCM10212_006553 [Sporobolomyces blumeae]
MPIRATPDQISRLGAFSTCEISDALVKLGNPTGCYVPDLEQLSGAEGQVVVGEAFTVQMVDAFADAQAPKLTDHFCDLATPGSVVFISGPSRTKSAFLGGLLATALSRKGVKGVMISGRCRDLAELRQLNLPVYARGHSTLGQSPFTRPSQVQVPLPIVPVFPLSSTDRCAEPSTPLAPVTVYPFDLVVADLDGVVVVRPETVERVIELATEARRIDELCRKDLERGKGVKETFKKHRGT